MFYHIFDMLHTPRFCIVTLGTKLGYNWSRGGVCRVRECRVKKKLSHLDDHPKTWNDHPNMKLGGHDDHPQNSRYFMPWLTNLLRRHSGLVIRSNISFFRVFWEGGHKLLGHMILIQLHFSLFTLSGVRQFLVVLYKIIVVILDF